MITNEFYMDEVARTANKLQKCSQKRLFGIKSRYSLT